MANPEARLQMVVVEFLRAVLPSDALMWATHNERKVSKLHGIYLNNMGRLAGVADLQVVYQGRPIFIELKLETNRVYGTKRTYQSDVQKQFQADIEKAGGLYCVCRNTDEVADFLVACGVPLRKTRWPRKDAA